MQFCANFVEFLKDFNPFSPEMIVRFISIISLLTAHFMLTNLVNLNFMIQALECEMGEI